MKLTRLSTLFLAALLPLAASAAPLKVDAAKSSLSAAFKQMGVPMEGKFRRFSAQIDFNAAKPETSKAAMDVEIPSFDLGDAEFNKEAGGKAWFNAAQFPKASFTSTAIKAAGAGKFDVSGKLTIKGKTADVAFPLTVKNEGAGQVFEGTLPIRRLAFNIGEGEWKDTSMVADEVVIKFRITATP